MKKWLICMLCALMIGMRFAQAEESAVYEGRVSSGEPLLTLHVMDTGRKTQDMPENNILQVTIEAQDGSLLQTLEWESIESPAFERIVPLVQLKDINFDGYNDLMLLSAQGASNVFYAFSLWDAEEQCFRPVFRDCEWLREEGRFSEEIKQVELCNPEWYVEKRMLVSEVHDGYRYSRTVFYMFDGSYHLTPKYICDVYDAGDGLIGEAMTEFLTRVTFLWDEQYPEEWYHGDNGVSCERRESFYQTALNGTELPIYRVANVDWVNLRKMDSKSSPSLAKLNAGERVTILKQGCGEENGWVRVLYGLDEHQPLTVEEYDSGRYMLTGYIWHSYLEKAE